MSKFLDSQYERERERERVNPAPEQVRYGASSPRHFLSSYFIKTAAVLFCVGFFLFGLAVKVQAANYYVDNSCSNNGNGSCNGTDPSCTCASGSGQPGPFNSIANMQAKAGGYSGDDNIYLKKGETFREHLTVPSSGTSGHPITFEAYGDGAAPIINGANVVTTGWTQATTTVSGTVTQANMRLSTSTAFVDFSSAGALTNYLGLQLVITDSTGKTLTGYIKAAGSGETTSSELLTNGNMETGSPPSNWTGYNATLSAIADDAGGGVQCLGATRTGSGSYGYQNITVTSGWLIKIIGYEKDDTNYGNLSFVTGSGSNGVTLHTSNWTSGTVYGTVDTGGTGRVQLGTVAAI